MQKFCCMALLIVALAMIGCHAAKQVQQPVAEATPYKGNGLELIEKSDCTTCHRSTEKLIGPGFQQIAQRYQPTPENIDKLVKKIIAGGSGNWSKVPMTPHPATHTPPNEIREMVKYILSLRK